MFGDGTFSQVARWIKHREKGQAPQGDSAEECHLPPVPSSSEAGRSVLCIGKHWAELILMGLLWEKQAVMRLGKPRMGSCCSCDFFRMINETEIAPLAHSLVRRRHWELPLETAFCNLCLPPHEALDPD